MRIAQPKIHAPPLDGNTNTTRITATKSPGIEPSRRIMGHLSAVGTESPTPVTPRDPIAA